MNHFKIVLFVILSVCFSLNVWAASGNLISNPGAEADTSNNPVTGWTTVLNGGDKMKVNWDSLVRSGSNSFQSSYSVDSVKQTVDLLANGYTQTQLDTQQPDIVFSLYLATRGDQAGRYYITYKLLGNDGSTVVATSGSTYGTSSSLLSVSSGTSWTQKSTTFSSYGAGARYLYVEFGGVDQSFWAGNYGTHFDDVSAIVNADSNYTLTVSNSGSGTGTVTSSPSGISCGSDCSESVAWGTSMTLTATASAGSTFSGWSGGGCSGTGTCIVSVTAATLVTAQFTVVPTSTPGSNHAPAIADEAGAELDCTPGTNCALPAWTASDADSDALTLSWVEVSGDTLQFTDDWEIDLANYHPTRGTYYVKYTAADGTVTTSSQTVTVTVPNNDPVIADSTDLSVADAELQDSKFVLSEFTKDIDVTATFTDYDDDNLSYSWSLENLDNDDWAGFTSTTSGASVLRSRIAGDITVLVSADDGNGGTTEEEMVISMPVPDVTAGDLDISLIRGLTTGGGMSISGSLISPVWPVVVLNGKAATVSRTGPASDLSGHFLRQTDSDSLDIYAFTASDVPQGSDSSTIDVAVYTPVNGENRLLATQNATGLSVIASAGCSLNSSGGGAWPATLILFMGSLFFRVLLIFLRPS